MLPSSGVSHKSFLHSESLLPSSGEQLAARISEPSRVATRSQLVTHSSTIYLIFVYLFSCSIYYVHGTILSGITIRDTLIGVLRPLLKTQTPVKATKPTASFQSGRKEGTRRSPACGPFTSPSNPRNDLRLARGSLRPAGQSPPRSRVANLPLSGANHLRLARGHP